MKILTVHSGFLCIILLLPIYPFLLGKVADSREYDDDRMICSMGGRREIFVDDWLIERQIGTSLRLHHPIRREVVFRFDAPWEGWQSGYVTVFKDGSRFRIYYRGGGDLSREYTCLAESEDGIHWQRPSLGLFTYNGTKENNIIWTGEKKAYFESHNFSPFKDTNPNAPSSERYKAVTLSRRPLEGETKKVLCAFVSPDGIHWKRWQENPIITQGSFDSHNTVFWDPGQKLYVCYFREGRDGIRHIRRSLSSNFRTWSQSEWLDFGNTPAEHFYTNGIMPYFRASHIYVGFPMRFVPERTRLGEENRKIDGLSDAVFISSRDGLHWKRTFKEAFIRPGLQKSNWGGAHGNNTPAWGILQTGQNELSLYVLENYGNYPWEKDRIPCLRRYTLRLDGFISVYAPYESAEMITKPLTFTGESLILNYSTSAVGSIKVEILDVKGRPVPKFTLDEAREIYGDEIKRKVSWQHGTDTSECAEHPVKLRFVMKDADLYSICFVP